MRVALVDGGSFVLPYDYQLAETLSAQGIEVEFHGSRTRYNGEMLEAMRRLPGVTVHDRALSRTVAPRWQGALGYLALWLGLWWRRRRFDAINLQFSAGWPLELPFLWALRRRLVFTVHNAVPHGFTGRRPRADRRGSPGWRAPWSSSAGSRATTSSPATARPFAPSRGSWGSASRRSCPGCRRCRTGRRRRPRRWCTGAP